MQVKKTVFIILLLITPLALLAADIYWETPELLIPASVRFIQAASNDRLGVVVWQDYEQKEPDTGDVYLSLLSSTDGIVWNRSLKVIGSYPYQGKQVPLFSVAVDDAGRIVVAVVSGERSVTVFSSADRGATFRRVSRLEAKETLVVPKLFLSSRNELLLLTSFLLGEELGIYMTRSASGGEWSPLTSLVRQDEGLSQQSLPFHTAHNGKDYIVFQAKRANTDFQLFLKTSYDGGTSWSRAVPLTDFPEEIGGEQVPADRISNQRPFLASFAGKLSLAWERNTIGRSPQVYIMTLDDGGKKVDGPTRISEGNANRYNPQVIEYRNELYYLWFDDSTRGQDNVFLYWKDGNQWKNRELSRVDGNSRFPRPLLIRNNLFIFWENQARAADRLFLLKPDAYVEPPRLTALNFVPPGFGRLSTVRFRWTVPDDPNGIDRFYFLISKSQNAPYTEAREVLKDVTQTDLEVPGEGRWYISVFARDYAGNVSRAVQLTYTRDSTPPGRVRFIPPETDDAGFYPSNTFTMRWSPPAGDEIAGYAYSLKLESPDFSRTVSESLSASPVPGNTVLLREPALEIDNGDNGGWALSVRAIDKAGNAGESETIGFKLRNYVPVTYITTVSAERNERQDLVVSIFGRGFSEGGLVDEVMIDRDGQPPYDFVFRRSEGQYRVESDRIIAGITLPVIDPGTYRIGVRHPARGLVFAERNALNVETSGVVKYGPFKEIYRPPVDAISSFFLSFSFSDVMIWSLVIFMALLVFIGTRTLITLGGEARTLRSEVTALIEGGDLSMPEKKKKIIALRKKGYSLRVKFTLLISLLVVMIVVIVALPISVFMISTQQRTLAENLFNKVDLVLGGIVEGTKTYLFEKNTLVLTENLTKQYSLLSNVARFAVITGPQFINPATGQPDLSDAGELDLSSMEHIWAVVDPDIVSKTENGEYIPIESKIKDPVSPLIPELARTINTEARSKVDFLNKEIDRINDEYQRYILRTDPEALATKERLRKELEEYTRQRDTELESIGKLVGSVPPFDPAHLDLSVGSYIFYKPVVTRRRGYDNYFWGMGRMGISMETINHDIRQSRDLLIVSTGVIALIALGLGVIGALIMASITIRPIRRLSGGVAVIRDTSDKSLLKDHVISVGTRDEIGQLADTVNQMTQGLVKAAIANKELVVGKEVQKMFIPLDTDASGKKGTTGKAENDFVDIFGYYEGAKGVSGDYFDFKKLDDKHYAIIKCDVAGKGVPAALIMVEVATIFLTFFRDWNFKKDGMKIDTLVYRMNDLLEERGFKGRFAALTVCLLNSETGLCTFCNAGDNLLHLYKQSKAKIQTVTLNNAPAAGVFPSMLVETQAGFKQLSHKLEKGDTLFLFTDGIEEAKRFFRDTDFNPVVCDESGVNEGELHGGTHARGSDNEELGILRFEEIVEAVFQKKFFSLLKHHNPRPEEELVFDFSGCPGTTEDVVTAVVAVEKIFRVYSDPAATTDDIVRVDKKIDLFLSRYFKGYGVYFTNRFEDPEEPDYVFFRNMKEDEQYDDLTILAVRKK